MQATKNDPIFHLSRVSVGMPALTVFDVTPEAERALEAVPDSIWKMAERLWVMGWAKDTKHTSKLLWMYAKVEVDPALLDLYMNRNYERLGAERRAYLDELHRADLAESVANASHPSMGRYQKMATELSYVVARKMEAFMNTPDSQIEYRDITNMQDMLSKMMSIDPSMRNLVERKNRREKIKDLGDTMRFKVDAFLDRMTESRFASEQAADDMLRGFQKGTDRIVDGDEVIMDDIREKMADGTHEESGPSRGGALDAEPDANDHGKQEWASPFGALFDDDPDERLGEERSPETG